LKRLRFALLIALFSSTISFSVDSAIFQAGPGGTAQKRQAEIERQTFCNEKAGREKLTKREIASFVVSCMDTIERAEQAVKNSQRVLPLPLD
jgi:hypothetical protein